MTLINSSLIMGLVLAGLPVLLHLMLRARPKKIEFPALRLLQSRQSSNSRRMKLRHLLLLALRILLIAIAVLAIARPSLPPAQYGLRWWEWCTLIGITTAGVSVYYWLTHKNRDFESGSNLRAERSQRIRLLTVSVCLLLILLTVGTSWGMRIRRELASPRNDFAENIPVAAVFIFDTSLSMTYQHENLSRLEHAQEVAAEHLSNLPQQSRVAVASTFKDDDVVFQADLTGARSRIESLDTQAISARLNSLIKKSIDAHLEDRRQVVEGGTGTDAYSREIYLFTDLSLHAWQDPDEAGLRDLLTEHSWLQVYLVDVSVDQPVNLSLSQLRLSEESTVSGREVLVSATVSATGSAPGSTTVEAFTFDAEGNAVRSGAPAIVRFEGSPPVAQFTIEALGEGQFEEGYLRISSSDPLRIDDIRHFAFGIRPRPRLLFVSDVVADNEQQSWYLRNVLQPVEDEKRGVIHYDCTVIPTRRFSTVNPSAYDVVCIVNCVSPDSDMWSALLDYVKSGGNVFAVVGGSFDLTSQSWWTADAEQLLPGMPIVPVEFRDVAGRLQFEQQHPISRRFESDSEAKTALLTIPFYKLWTVEQADDTSTLMSFRGQKQYPALLERRVGEGRCIMFTSAVDYFKEGGRAWNDLPAEWVFLDFAEHIVRYLTGAEDQRHNFTVGDTVDIRVPASQRFNEYLVARPRFRQTRGEWNPDERTLLITDTDDSGTYRVRSDGSDADFEFLFAANMVDGESELTAADDEMLDSILGEDNYSRVADPNQLERVVQVGRLGIEVFPVLLGLLILLFCLEHLMANFFYDTQSNGPASESASA